MEKICKESICTGCRLCESVCKKDAITIVNKMFSTYAIIDENRCIKCNLCKKLCPQLNDNIAYMKQIYWKQGWANDSYIRNQASSGGIASALIYDFISKGNYVASCVQTSNKDFGFLATNKIEDIYNFSGSKYVKSNPKGIYEIVLKLLKQNNKVLFIGLPCQVVALKKYVGERLQHKLFTVDLICHGTPSEELLTAFLKQYLPIEKIKKITFRDNINCTIAIDGKKILPDRLVDCYTSIFMNGEIYTEGCYHCKYARNERVSDVTLGDSWNSSLPSEQKQKGISLILCQTEKGKDMIDSVDLRLYDIDLEIARKNNAQLNNPAKYSKKRYRFICGLNKGIQFNIMYYLIYPKMFLKNFVKMVLYKLRIWRIV